MPLSFMKEQQPAYCEHGPPAAIINSFCPSSESAVSSAFTARLLLAFLISSSAGIDSSQYFPRRGDCRYFHLRRQQEDIAARYHLPASVFRSAPHANKFLCPLRSLFPGGVNSRIRPPYSTSEARKITIFSSGTSCIPDLFPVFTRAMASTISRPSVTLPKTA